MIDRAFQVVHNKAMNQVNTLAYSPTYGFAQKTQLCKSSFIASFTSLVNAILTVKDLAFNKTTNLVAKGILRPITFVAPQDFSKILEQMAGPGEWLKTARKLFVLTLGSLLSLLSSLFCFVTPKLARFNTNLQAKGGYEKTATVAKIEADLKLFQNLKNQSEAAKKGELEVEIKINNLDRQLSIFKEQFAAIVDKTKKFHSQAQNREFKHIDEFKKLKSEADAQFILAQNLNKELKKFLDAKLDLVTHVVLRQKLIEVEKKIADSKVDLIFSFDSIEHFTQEIKEFYEIETGLTPDISTLKNEANSACNTFKAYETKIKQIKTEIDTLCKNFREQRDPILTFSYIQAMKDKENEAKVFFNEAMEAEAKLTATSMRALARWQSNPPTATQEDVSEINSKSISTIFIKNDYEEIQQEVSSAANRFTIKISLLAEGIHKNLLDCQIQMDNGSTLPQLFAQKAEKLDLSPNDLESCKEQLIQMYFSLKNSLVTIKNTQTLINKLKVLGAVDDAADQIKLAEALLNSLKNHKFIPNPNSIALYETQLKDIFFDALLAKYEQELKQFVNQTEELKKFTDQAYHTRLKELEDSSVSIGDAVTRTEKLMNVINLTAELLKLPKQYGYVTDRDLASYLAIENELAISTEKFVANAKSALKLYFETIKKPL